jgi:serine/threonine-protein kinase
MTPERWQQVKQIFHAALERRPAVRSSFLGEACGADASLRSEVESLISAHEEDGSFVDSRAFGTAAGLLDDEPAALQPHQRFGTYEIVAPLGKGGMGEVYLASDRRLGRRVALKILPRAFTHKTDRLRRFGQEARAASALNHPNIITIYEIGESDGAHFIATEHIEGETLRERLCRAHSSVDESLCVAIQIADALAAAHKAGIIHRDIKPENVMLRPDGYVKVLDFGLAKLSERRAGGDSDLEAPTLALVNTSPGVVMGTVNYMSPEQARGLQVDARTDIWSLGVVLYEMLTGHLPFEGKDIHRQIIAIQEQEFSPLSRFAEGIPERLEEIVGKALAKEPDRRFQTAKDLLIDLQNLKRKLEVNAEIARVAPPELKGATHESTVEGSREVATTMPARAVAETAAVHSLHTLSSVEYIVNEINRRKRSFAAVALTALLAAVGLGYWFFAHRTANATQLDSIAVLPFVNENGNTDVEYLSDGMTESLINSLSQLPKLSVKARSSVFSYKGRDVKPQQVGSELNVQAVLNGRVVQRGDDLTLYLSLVDTRAGNQIWGEQYSRKLADLVALQSEIAGDVSNKLRVKLSGADEQRLAKNYTANNEAYQLYLRGRFYWNRHTVSGFRKAIEYYQQAVAADPNYALAYAGLADSYASLSDYNGAPPREVIPKARQAALKALSLDERLVEAHAALGLVLHDDYDFAGAEREYKRALELNPNDARTHLQYGWLLSHFARHEEGLAKARRALEMEPLSLIINRSYGDLLFYARKYDESIAQLKKTLDLDFNFESTHNSLGYAYWMKGEYAESVEEFAKRREAGGSQQLAALVRESFVKGGWEGFLRMRIGEFRTSNPSSYAVAIYHAALGEKDEAFAELNKAYENREFGLVLLKVDPRLDPLRSDPRFADLVRKVGLPQ